YERIRNQNAQRRLDAWFSATAPKEFSGRYSSVTVVPNIALVEQQGFLQSGWWPRLETPFFGENLDDPLHIENLATSASKRSSSQFSTRFDLPVLPGWNGSFSPRLSLSSQRNMPQ